MKFSDLRPGDMYITSGSTVYPQHESATVVAVTENHITWLITENRLTKIYRFKNFNDQPFDEKGITWLRVKNV